MVAGDLEPHRAQRLAPSDHLEVRGAAGQLDPLGAQVRLGVLPHPDDLEAAGPRDLGQRCGSGVVEAEHQEAGGVDPGHEVLEGRAVGLLGAPDVEVVGLDVGHHRGVRRVDQEGAVALVGLGDEDLARPLRGVGAGGGEVAADV